MFNFRDRPCWKCWWSHNCIDTTIRGFDYFVKHSLNIPKRSAKEIILQSITQFTNSGWRNASFALYYFNDLALTVVSVHFFDWTISFIGENVIWNSSIPFKNIWKYDQKTFGHIVLTSMCLGFPIALHGNTSIADEFVCRWASVAS